MLVFLGIWWEQISSEQSLISKNKAEGNVEKLVKKNKQPYSFCY